MTSHEIAWLIAGVSAPLLAVTLIAILRIKGAKRYWIAVFIVATALAPYRFDGEHYAPAFIVGLFRVLFEDHAYAGRPWILLAAIWFIIAACYLLAATARALLRRVFRLWRLSREGQSG